MENRDIERVEPAPEQPPVEVAPEIEVADRGMSGVEVEQAEVEPHYDEVYLNGLTDLCLLYTYPSPRD